MSALPSPRRRTLAAILTGSLVTALALVAVPGILPASADRTTLTFGYSDSVQTLTVPEGITQLTVSMLGGEGGLGGADSVGPIQGGYRGVVTGTLTVTPGEVLTFGVGHGGFDGQSVTGSAAGGTGGGNPIAGYDGGTGGIAGPEGSSGGGAGGGAATVLQVGDQTIVAGGGGGGGGSGQFMPTQGRPGAASFTARDDATTGVGQNGINTASVCVDGIRCDGGASGAGGGGAIGGGPGQVAYGADYSTEYYGYGGSPGANDARGLTSGTAVYQYYDTDGADGSITITYDTSAPGAPTGVAGTAADGAAHVSWLAPLSNGGGAITDYVLQYAVAGDSPDWQDYADATSASTSAVVTGLANGTAYVFRVAAINTFGTSDYSDASGSVTPSPVPGAPTLSGVTASDGSLVVSFSTVTAISPVTGYEYRVNTGSWVAAGASSPVTISGLANGTSYSITVRAINAIGAGAASNALSGTPLSIPGAPTITGIATGIGTATVSFTAGNAGGSPVTGYQYSLDSGTWTSTSSTTSPFTITGLANGSSHSLALRATSLAGDGAASAASTFATPSTPSAPSIGLISVGDGTLSVPFTAGGNGGLAISGYEYQLVTSGVWTAAPSLSSPLALTGLSNGTSYQVSIRAVNALGAGAAATPVAATPITTPGAPTLLAGSVAGGDQELDATFSAPASNGGSTITGYEYSTDGGVTWRARAAGTTASPLVITTLSSDGTTALVNGVTYSVEVRAINAAGAGTSSGVAVGIARTVPSAPSLTGVASRPGSLQVSFASAANGGSPITSYQYRLGSGLWTDTGTLAQTFTIAGLTNGSSYAVQVRAVNAVGPSAPSTAQSGVPASAPGQATLVSIAPGNASLWINASVASNGGAAISGWQYSTDGGTTWASASGTSGTFTISSRSDAAAALVNGTSYSVAVRALNSAGTGAASSTQHGVPMASPSAPVVSVTPQDSGLAVSYVAGSTGGSSVTAVQYSVGAGWVTVGSLQTSFAIGSLVNGTAYPVQVRLVNAIGAGDASATSSATPRTVPGAPRSVTASPDGGQATVSWQTPSSDGGSAVTGYTATAWSSASTGSAVGSCTSTGLSCVIAGLTNGVAYFVSVTATNAAGEGAASAPRIAVVPLAKPGAPTIDSIGASNTFLSVYFSAGDQGSSPITGYEYSLNGGDWMSTAASASPLVISGLLNGDTYTVQLRADNASGAGAASNSVDGTPFSEPDVPDASKITVTPGSYSATVNWAAPDDNGSPIYEYNVVAWSSLIQGYQVDSCSAWDGDTSCTLGNLWDGGTFYVTVDATNAAGTTARSTPRIAVTPGAPGAVEGLTGVAGDGQVDLSWTPGSAGDSDIDGYQVWYAPVGSTTFTQFGDDPTDSQETVTGLTNGTTYTFTVYATNAYGVGEVATSGEYTPLAAGVVPTFGDPVRTADGFTATISPYDPTTAYSVTSDVGAAELSDDTITVTGLTPGQFATVSVTAAGVGVAVAHGSVASQALYAGTTPEFGTPTHTVDGFTVELLNPVAGVSYDSSVSAGTVTNDGTSYTVSGLSPAQSSTLTLLATDAGYTDAQAEVTSSALGAGVSPLLSDPTCTDDGFIVTLLNPDVAGAYTYSVTAGAVAADGITITVTGLAPGETATLTVTAVHPVRTDASTEATAAALELGADLTRSPVTQFANGFTFSLVNYDPSFAYVVTTDAGILSFVNGVVTVTGLAPGQVATVHITATKPGSRDAEVGVEGNPTPRTATETGPTVGTVISSVGEPLSVSTAVVPSAEGGTVEQAPVPATTVTHPKKTVTPVHSDDFIWWPYAVGAAVLLLILALLLAWLRRRREVI